MSGGILDMPGLRAERAENIRCQRAGGRGRADLFCQIPVMQQAAMGKVVTPSIQQRGRGSALCPVSVSTGTLTDRIHASTTFFPTY